MDHKRTCSTYSKVTPELALTPQVSIGMPVYNGEPFLREALESLIQQTFIDFELIISDNSSTDNTEEICREYAAKDPRVRYVRQPANRGSLFNFKYVLDQASGEYFMWAACDDLRENDFIEKLLIGFRNKEVTSAFSISREINEHGRIICDKVNFDFNANSPVVRIWKYSTDYRELRDMPIYGLHKRDMLNKYKSRIKPWGWINKTTPVNSAHPIMIYILASGQHYMYSERTLFSRRVVLNQQWKNEIAFRVTWAKQIAFAILKLQLFLRSVNAVLVGTESLLVAIRTSPILLYGSMRPLLKKFLYPIYKRIKNKI